MKSILTLLICTISLYSSPQCVKFYIQEHSSGSRICNLSAGDYIEICEDENEVNGCPRNFYIYDKGYLRGSLTYELSLDRGWSTHYMTLMVNPNTKRIGFSLQGQNGVYSYITEKEMELIRAEQEKQQAIIRAEQEKQQAIENKKLEELAKLQDKKRYLLIDQLYLEKKIEAAKNEMDKLNYPQSYKNKKTIEAEYLLFVKAQLDREALEDLTNIHNIRILLNSSDIEKVVQSWVSLHSKTNLQNIKDSIFQFILKNETGNIPISLANSDLTKFIELNKVQIGNSYKSITKDTNIIIQFDQLGKCLQKESYLWNSTVFKKYSDEFFTYQTLKIPVSLKVMFVEIKDKNHVFYSGSQKKLAIFSSGRNFYQYNGFTKPYLSGSDVIEYTFNKDLPRNKVTTGVFWGQEVYANNIKISTIEIEKQSTSKIKKRIFRIVGRSVVFATTISYLVLRSIK